MGKPQTRRTITRLTVFYKALNGALAIPFPQDIYKNPLIATRHRHWKAYIQMETGTDSFKYVFFKEQLKTGMLRQKSSFSRTHPLF